MLVDSIGSPHIDEASRYRILKIYAQSSIPKRDRLEVRRRVPIAIQRV
jgi:hypothetical protein